MVRIQLIQVGLGSIAAGAIAALQVFSIPATALVPSRAIELAQMDSESSALAAKAEAFLGFLESGEYETARSLLDPVVQNAWSAEAIERTWQNFRELVGSSPTRRTSQVTNNLVSITIDGDNFTDNLLFVFDSEGDLVGLDLPRVRDLLAGYSKSDIAEAFIDAMATGNFEEARVYLYPVLRAEWSPEVLAERWQSFEGQVGTFRQRQDTETVENVVFVRIQFDRLEDWLVFIFNDDNQIVGVDFPQIDWDRLETSTFSPCRFEMENDLRSHLP
ncbi:hypothetical protein AY599_04440 [Leptolyngbya valderiana BDU 20041]|nr:hypothetical protein AY599_04440 [Leptolyngbya valderiana BDU 20041]